MDWTRASKHQIIFFKDLQDMKVLEFYKNAHN